MSESSTPWVEGQTIGNVLRTTARQHPQQDALVFPQRDYRATYAEFDRLVDDAARGLLALGLQKGEHLALWCTNWPEWVILQFATARVGIVLVTINPAYRAEELEYALRQSDAQVVALVDAFKTSDYFATLAQVCPELAGSTPGKLQSAKLPKLHWAVSLAPGKVASGMIGWHEVLARGQAVTASELAQRENQVRPFDPVNIQYTSGTTGFPKGATLSHRNLLRNAYHTGACQRITARDRICIPVPFYHCFGCVLGTMCAAVYGAAMVVPHEYFDSGKTLEAISKERCTAIYGVPTMFIAELEHPQFAQHDMSSLRTGIMAGSPCPIELMKKVTTTMGAREITIAYGQTEASPVITQTRTDDPLELRVTSVGRPLPGVEAKIVDPGSGADLADGQPGELCARGHVVMLGYYNNPQATDKAIDKDGWLHTGDIGVRQSNGYFHITGRLKDMIIRGGEKLYPREIEECLHHHPKVQDVQVVGVPDVKFGEQALACIKLRPGQSATDKEMRDYCREHLSHFKVPHYVRFVDSFPMTVTGKIQKFKMREQAIKELGLESAAAVKTA